MLDQEGDRSGKLSASGQTLHQAKENQQDGGDDADAGVGRQKPHQSGRGAHENGG